MPSISMIPSAAPSCRSTASSSRTSRRSEPRLHPRRTHFLPADIDDAALAADEIIALAAALDDVAGIDEPVLADQARSTLAEVADTGAVRADAQRTVHDLHVDRAAAVH